MNGIVVTSIGLENIEKYTLKTIELYCKKYNLGLEIIKKSKLNINLYNYPSERLEKNQVYDYFDKYERILRLDLDVLISKNCPNLFDIVPKEKIGAYGHNIDKENKRIKNLCNYFGKINNNDIQKYFNSGVVLCSRKHKNIFKINKKDIKNLKKSELPLLEQNFLNWKVNEKRFKTFDIGYKFNHYMPINETLNVKYRNFESKYKSYIIHRANLGKELKEQKIKKDFFKLGFHKGLK